MKSLKASLERMGDYEWMDRIRAGKQFSPSIKVGKLSSALNCISQKHEEFPLPSRTSSDGFKYLENPLEFQFSLPLSHILISLVFHPYVIHQSAAMMFAIMFNVSSNPFNNASLYWSRI